MKYIFIILLFISCGTRKVENTKRDSISIENKHLEGSKIVLGNTFEYRPFDSLKPMIIEGKEYTNVIISKNKSKTIEKWKDRIVTKKEVVYRTKTVEKKDDSNLYIGLFFAFGILVVIFLILKKYKIL